MSVYECYEGGRYICTGTFDEIAETVGLSPVTIRSYATGVGGHRYQLYRIPPRPGDIEDKRRYGLA